MCFVALDLLMRDPKQNVVEMNLNIIMYLYIYCIHIVYMFYSVIPSKQTCLIWDCPNGANVLIRLDACPYSSGPYR